jgi:hypothetical protein
MKRYGMCPHRGHPCWKFVELIRFNYSCLVAPPFPNGFPPRLKTQDY